MRTYREAVGYAPNQVFIGNMEPDTLRTLKQPWFEHLLNHDGTFGRTGPFGEIMPQEEFYALLKAATDESSFDLVWLESRFLAETVSPAIAKHRLCNSGDLLQKLGHVKTM